MRNTDYLSRFLMRFDPDALRRSPSWLAWGAIAVCSGAALSIASLNPLAIIGGVVAFVGVVVAAELRDEGGPRAQREFDLHLVENYRAALRQDSRGRLGEGWEDEVVAALERCSQSWVRVMKALARRRWIYRALTKSWRNLWVGAGWAADTAMLEALWAAQMSQLGAPARGAALGSRKREAVLRLQQISRDMDSLAFHLTKDAIPRPVDRAAVQSAVNGLDFTQQPRQ